MNQRGGETFSAVRVSALVGAALLAAACQSSSPAAPVDASGDGVRIAGEVGVADGLADRAPAVDADADLRSDQSQEVDVPANADAPDAHAVDAHDGAPDASDATPDAAAIETAPPDSSDGLGDRAESDAARVGDGGDASVETAPPACPDPTDAVPPPCASLNVVVAPYYAASYVCYDLGPVPGLPAQKYGGLALLLDRCGTELLIGGAANEASGKLYRIRVTRDGQGHINGFVGTATAVIDAPFNDGGVAFGPGGVLFVTRWPANQLQQTVPGSARADKVIDLAPLGVAQASASLNFVPDPLPTTGALKLVSWSGGQWYSVEYRPDGTGTYDVVAAKHVLTLPGGPEGLVYVQAGSALFPTHGLLVSEWTANKIASYEVDAAADPKLGTRRDFITGLQGAEGAYRDPDTGDFFFSTWGQQADRVIVVRGFAPIHE